MPLVEVRNQQSTAKATDMQPQVTHLLKRFTKTTLATAFRKPDFAIPIESPIHCVDSSWLLLQVTKRVETAESQWKNWNWRSEDDLLLNGAYFTPSGAGASASYAMASSLEAKSSSMVGAMTSNAGALGCRRGHQC